jgi:hypothetical protein
MEVTVSGMGKTKREGHQAKAFSPMVVSALGAPPEKVSEVRGEGEGSQRGEQRQRRGSTLSK